MTEHLVGIDVSSEKLDIAHAAGAAGSTRHQYSNTRRGHTALIRNLQRRGTPSRVLLEATGIYFFDLAMALAQTPGVEVMVLNPRSLRHYRMAEGRRAKTDVEDAELALEYLRRMPFQRWSPPGAEVLALKQLSRQIDHFIDVRTAAKNRLEAHDGSEHTLPSVIEATQRHIEYLNVAIHELEQEAYDLIRSTPALVSAWRLMQTIPGIAEKSGLSLLAELASLPDGLGVRQWVAMAGLDPTVDQSGKRVRGKKRISRRGNAHIRRALYMPAVVAASRNDHFKAFQAGLIERGKPTRVAQVAVMRKILHAIYGILKTGTAFDAEKLFPKLQIA